MKSPTLIPPVLLTALLLGAAGCSRPVKRESATIDILGRAAVLELTARDAPRIDALASILQGEMGGLRKVLDASRPDSEIRRVNQLAGSMSLPVSKTISQILILSRRANEATEGAFDLTLEPYQQIWGFRGGPVPDSPPVELLDAARSVLGMKRISQRADMVGFDNEVVSISIDPVLEGYLADLCILKLRGSLVNDAMVRVGRAMRVLGSKSEQDPWVASVSDPRGDGSTELGRLMLGGAKERQAANSCHAFDQYVEGLGGRISWVMDPATGLPATRTLYALVVASTSFEADALSYALVVRGVEGAPRLMARFPKCEALVMPSDGSAAWLTAGMREIFTPADGAKLDLRELVREAPPAPQPQPAQNEPQVENAADAGSKPAEATPVEPAPEVEPR